MQPLRVPCLLLAVSCLTGTAAQKPVAGKKNKRTAAPGSIRQKLKKVADSVSIANARKDSLSAAVANSTAEVPAVIQKKRWARNKE